jgi:hypothetical protein
MELNLYFFGLIISISVIHLASVAVNYIGASRSKGPLNKKSQPAKSQQRNDWYVFFHCADLLGRETSSASLDRPKSEHPTKALPKQESKRPTRIHARM